MIKPLPLFAGVLTLTVAGVAGAQYATLFVCALSVSGAIFLLLELDQPFHGFIRVSSAPLRSALTNLGS